MKLLIEIPEEDYHRIASGFGQEEDAVLLEKIFKNGKPLPESCEDTISRNHLLSEIDDLMKSPWFNNGKDSDLIVMHYGYIERKEAVEVVRDLCVKTEPPVTPKQRTGDFTRQELENWLYSICLNNVGTDFCKDIEEIISRLDGFERYVEDMRGVNANDRRNEERLCEH